MQQISIFDLMEDKEYLSACNSQYLEALESLKIYLILYEELVEGNYTYSSWDNTSEFYSQMGHRINNLNYKICSIYFDQKRDEIKPYIKWCKEVFLKFYNSCPKAYKKILERSSYRVYLDLEEKLI